jgi:hypothetical protein
VHRLRGSPPEPVSSEHHSVGFLRRGFLRCAAAPLAATHLALRTSVGVPSAWFARASRDPSARSSPAAIVWPPLPSLRASLSCLVGLTEPFARLGESPNMPSCSLRQVRRARFRRCRLRRALSSGLTRTRACSTRRPRAAADATVRQPSRTARSLWLDCDPLCELIRRSHRVRSASQLILSQLPASSVDFACIRL